MEGKKLSIASDGIIGVSRFCPNKTRSVSGTYRSRTIIPPYGFGFSTMLELRIDVDRHRPQNRLSGDFFTIRRLTKLYSGSFVVNSLTIDDGDDEMVISGPIVYYSEPGRTNDTIEVRVPRVSFCSRAPAASVKILHAGRWEDSYVCDFISAYFRFVDLEIDRFQGTGFPPDANICTDPHPADLHPFDISLQWAFELAGIDMSVTEDDVLNDPDSPDTGNNWDEGELHDLMEDHFDRFSNTLQWNLYGVVVPRFGDPNYNSGFYGVMFDFGGYITGDTYHRQGAAIAWDALRGYESGTLYNTDAKKDRFVLQTFIHELGHAFNLPHTWDRTESRDSASESFMNYPWYYPGGEHAFWSNFRWQFDDVELIWMRHANRNDLIFGGRDWIGNNLSIYSSPERDVFDSALNLEVRTLEQVPFGVPIHIELKLKNVSKGSQNVINLMEPEDGFVTIFIKRPNEDIVQYIPPMKRMKIASNVAELPPGGSFYESILLSFGAKGLQFKEPGEYLIRAYYHGYSEDLVISNCARLRVEHPLSSSSEELANLMFSPSAAKIFYFGGSERYPEVILQMQDYAKKYAISDPVAVRHIHEALGRYHHRSTKRIAVKDGKRTIITRKANHEAAVKHFEAAKEFLSNSKISPLDNISYNKLSLNLADSYLKLGQKEKSAKSLNQTLKYFKERGVVKSVIEDYERRIKELKEQD